MSKLLSAIERVGTVAMKFQFEIVLHTLNYSSSPALSSPVIVKWTRGPRQLRSEAVYGVSGVYSWPESKNSLTMLSTLYSKKGKFQSKKCKLSAKAVVNRDYKTLGYIELDLADFAAPYPLTKEFNMKLGHSSDKKATMKFTVNAKWLKQLGAKDAENDNDDTVSQISGISVLHAENSDSETHFHHDVEEEEETKNPKQIATATTTPAPTPAPAPASAATPAPTPNNVTSPLGSRPSSSPRAVQRKPKIKEEDKTNAAPSIANTTSAVKPILEPKKIALTVTPATSAIKIPKTSNVTPLSSPSSAAAAAASATTSSPPSVSSSSSSSSLSSASTSSVSTPASAASSSSSSVSSVSSSSALSVDTSSVQTSIEDLKKDVQSAQTIREEKAASAKLLQSQLNELTEKLKQEQQSNSLSNERLESFFTSLMKLENDLGSLVKSLDDEKRRSQNLLASFTLMEQRLDFIKENALKETERTKERVKKLEENERILKKKMEEEKKKWEDEKRSLQDSMKEKLKEMRAKVAGNKAKNHAANPFGDGDEEEEEDGESKADKKKQNSSRASAGDLEAVKKENLRLLDSLSELKDKLSSEQQKSSDLFNQVEEVKQKLQDSDKKSQQKSLYALSSEEEIHREIRRRRHEETAELVDSLLDSRSELRISPAKQRKAQQMQLQLAKKSEKKDEKKDKENDGSASPTSSEADDMPIELPEERPIDSMEEDEKNETILHLRRTVQLLKNQLDEMKSRNTALNEKNGVLNKMAEEQVPTLKNDLKVHAEKISWMQKQSDALQKKYDDEKKKWLDEEKSLNVQIDTMRAQRGKFDALKQAALKSSAEKTLQGRVQFYEEQLQEAEEMLLSTKRTWQETNTILQNQVSALEKEVTQLKNDLSEERTLKGNESTRIAQLDVKLKKAELAKSKLSELMNRFEVELVQKKIDLANQADSLTNLDYEHQRVVSALHKANQQIEIQNKQIGVLKNTISKLESNHRETSK